MKLTPDELRMLEHDPVLRALDPAAQRDFIVSNRKVGRAVTAFALGVRVVLLWGAGISALALARDALLVGLGVIVLAIAVWATLGLRRRWRELSAPVPELDAWPTRDQR
ncbi:hypothetical protein [Sandaracinus amylolyticus]|uniref:hypothetical protein n=1 Tax=Sandaracinus amylolyticus TaxID=927083 RepID=UPI001F33AB76|nr:hypothetical protein [Sandaracinus amylolyticus]UJR82082.1 Hypothetical protein I5071_41470 [Sandaracinus amylolyticus]